MDVIIKNINDNYKLDFPILSIENDSISILSQENIVEDNKITGQRFKISFWEIGEFYTPNYFIKVRNENDKEKLYSALNKSVKYPAIALPQYQFFSVDRFHLTTRLCVVLNKKHFPNKNIAVRLVSAPGGSKPCLTDLTYGCPPALGGIALPTKPASTTTVRT